MLLVIEQQLIINDGRTDLSASVTSIRVHLACLCMVETYWSPHQSASISPKGRLLTFRSSPPCPDRHNSSWTTVTLDFRAETLNKDLDRILGQLTMLATLIMQFKGFAPTTSTPNIPDFTPLSINNYSEPHSNVSLTESKADPSSSRRLILLILAILAVLFILLYFILACRHSEISTIFTEAIFESQNDSLRTCPIRRQSQLSRWPFPHFIRWELIGNSNSAW
ncbi:unnamed protein product [Protopolystoma xenopodis]|uniref:Uncharacterized protein n=1 Tax=Protopolystoma xenopodis TaxID=117903 RepID=A0A3S5AS22_9PLAT|nr:unnamed protein product [Protopolystoma xenopodis]